MKTIMWLRHSFPHEKGAAAHTALKTISDRQLRRRKLVHPGDRTPPPPPSQPPPGPGLAPPPWPPLALGGWDDSNGPIAKPRRRLAGFALRQGTAGRRSRTVTPASTAGRRPDAASSAPRT